jgi:hypothetical protein
MRSEQVDHQTERQTEYQPDYRVNRESRRRVGPRSVDADPRWVSRVSFRPAAGERTQLTTALHAH